MFVVERTHGHRDVRARRPGTHARPAIAAQLAVGCTLGTPAHSACDGAPAGAPFACPPPPSPSLTAVESAHSGRIWPPGAVPAATFAARPRVTLACRER